MKSSALKLYRRLRKFTASLADDDGQDLIEYSLLRALIALAATAGITGVATQVGNALPASERS